MSIADEARQILASEAMNTVFDGVREKLVQSIENNGITDDAMRDKLMLSLQILKSVRQELQTFIDDELMASSE